MKPMHRRLQYFNLFGVVALVLLCVAQWRIDRRLNLEISRLGKVRIQQAAKIEEQDHALKDTKEDLSQFKESFAQATKAQAETQKSLRLTERTNQQVTLERDQLKVSVTNWMNAVAVRDESLKEANVRIRKLADDLNMSILKFNELATNYNAVVGAFDRLRSQLNTTNSSTTPGGSPNNAK